MKMKTNNKSEYTGRPRSDKNERSTKSYSEKQNILSLGRIQQATKELFREEDSTFQARTTAPGGQMEYLGNPSSILLLFITVFIPGSVTWASMYIDGHRRAAGIVQG